MAKFIREQLPGFYKVYQEFLGELYYEILCIGCLLRWLSRKRLQALEATTPDPLEVANSYRGLGLFRSIRPYQVKSEIGSFYKIVKRKKPAVVCEIGSDKGGTLYLWSKAASSEATFISIDLPRTYRKSFNRFFRFFFKQTQSPHFVRADSKTDSCEEKVRNLLAGREIDFLFIDGDHSYEGVKNDFDRFSKFVQQTGMIAFHDIRYQGVSRFWGQIKTRYEYREIFEDDPQNEMGIGILFLSQDS